MKRRDFIKGIITVSLATATVTLCGPTAAGAIGSQVRQGVHRELREENKTESIKEDKADAQEKNKDGGNEEKKPEDKAGEN